MSNCTSSNSLTGKSINKQPKSLGSHKSEKGNKVNVLTSGSHGSDSLDIKQLRSKASKSQVRQQPNSS
jgi:hypothetical protein